MNAHSRSSSFSVSLNPRSRSLRRPSVSSRLSFAVSTAETAERGESQNNDSGRAIAAQRQIDDEIAKIKRYEVSTQHGPVRPREPVGPCR